jgi:hypothetical protein
VIPKTIRHPTLSERQARSALTDLPSDMWLSRTKNDLIIEVWERLDCESIGASEIEAIETVVMDRYGNSAIESPMIIARLLADEGAELRHSELMGLYVKRAAKRPYDSALLNLDDIRDLKNAVGTIKKLENLRQKYVADNDREGLRHVRQKGLQLKRSALEIGERPSLDAITRQINSEIAQWLIVWLQTPEIFETWVDLRQQSPEFIEKFGRIGTS